MSRLEAIERSSVELVKHNRTVSQDPEVSRARYLAHSKFTAGMILWQAENLELESRIMQDKALDLLIDVNKKIKKHG